MVKFTKTKPPIPLLQSETYLYKYIVRFLKDNNAFNPVDSLTIAEASKCYFRLLKFEADANSLGWVQEYENGSNLSTHAVLYYKEEKRWSDYCKAFGLHVKARDTIKVFRADNEDGKKGLIRHLQAMHKQASNG